MCLSKEKKIEKWIRKKNSGKLAKEVNNSIPEIRLKVIEALGEVGDFPAVSALSSIIRDSDPKIRLASLNAISKTGDERAKEHVRYLSEKDEDPNVRDKAKEVLGSLSTKVKTES